MLKVVIEAEMSISTGPCGVGMPCATGFGVNTPFSPPNGATCAPEGDEDAIDTSMPWSVARCR